MGGWPQSLGPRDCDVALSHTHTQSYGLFKLPGFQIWKKIEGPGPWAPRGNNLRAELASGRRAASTCRPLTWPPEPSAVETSGIRESQTSDRSVFLGLDAGRPVGVVVTRPSTEPGTVWLLP